MRLRRGSLSITTPVSFLANEFDVRSVLHGQVSLAAVYPIYVFHEAMNGCKNKDSLQTFFENVNIDLYRLMFMLTCHLFLYISTGHTSSLQSGFEGTTNSPSNIALAFYDAMWAYDGW